MIGDIKILITLTGMRVIGAVHAEDVASEFIMLRGASTIEMDPTQTRMNFGVLELAEPEKPLAIRKTGILAETIASAMIKARFMMHLQQIDLDAEKRGLDQ